MELNEYNNDDIIKEIKHRHIKIKIIQSNVYQVVADKPNIIKIGKTIFKFLR